MATMSSLIEFLLAYERPGGGRICKFGALQILIPIFPPGMTVNWSTTPFFNSYANILFWTVVSPAIVPGVFAVDTDHYGLTITSSILSSAASNQGHNTWVEITEAHPLDSTITNNSNLPQHLEMGNVFLVVDSREDLEIIRGLTLAWGSSMKQESLQVETNQLIRELVSAMKGQVVTPTPVTPYPPIGGRR